jgi:hypothetical protein
MLLASITYLTHYVDWAASSIGGAGGNPACRTSAFEAVCTFNPF